MSALAALRPQPLRRVALLGLGQVGRALLARWQEAVDPRWRLGVVATSARRWTDPDGLAPAHLLEGTLAGESHDGSDVLLSSLVAGDLVIDASASADLAAHHPRWLRRGLHVVSANKLGLGGPLLRHHEIRALASGQGPRYGDAATVGAGLPVLRTIQELRAGGDRIDALAGVLSGTLAWLFDGFDGSAPFSQRVDEAVARGYAEPDPRVDLSGEDVRRKLLILARAAGQPLEQGEVRVESLLTPERDQALAWRAQRAAEAGRVLRYVARLDAGGARIGLESLERDDPLALGRGCDNRIAIWSSRYRERPLQIQGPGAGAGVTAAALLDDVLRVVSADRG